MVKVNVATLKAELSRYLELVETGEQVLITSHGKEIATITSAQTSPATPINWKNFAKKHSLLKTKSKGLDAASLIRSIRDED